MKTSDAGLAFIAQEEGTVLHVYKDISGYDTIGIGHLLSAEEKASGVFAKGITRQQAIDLLAHDIIRYEAAVNKCVNVPMTQNQFDALVSFTYNLGVGAIAGSGLLAKFNAGDVNGAADEFLKWCKARVNGELVTVQGLLNRRKRERAVFLKPDVVVPTPPAPPPAPPPPPPTPSLPEPAPVPVSDPTPPLPVPSPPPAPPQPAPVSPLQAIINFLLMLFRTFFGGDK